VVVALPGQGWRSGGERKGWNGNHKEQSPHAGGTTADSRSLMRVPDARDKYHLRYIVLPMNLRDVAVFVAVAEAGGFAEAARRSGCPQSTISRRVASLEQCLGQELFVRGHGPARLSEAGQRLLVDAPRLLELDRRARLSVVDAVPTHDPSASGHADSRE
jgi:molybdenum-dependent DNA-binding transcriptional regulator ModE